MIEKLIALVLSVSMMAVFTVYYVKLWIKFMVGLKGILIWLRKRKTEE